MHVFVLLLYYFDVLILFFVWLTPMRCDPKVCHERLYESTIETIRTRHLQFKVITTKR